MVVKSKFIIVSQRSAVFERNLTSYYRYGHQILLYFKKFRNNRRMGRYGLKT
jgi:hypothetical protein